MPEKIKIGIVGWGNIGRGVYQAIQKNPDMEFTGIITRDPARVLESLHSGSGIWHKNVYSVDQSPKLKGVVDVAVLCGGSKNDLPVQGPQFAQYFNTVDSFDNHSMIPNYFKAMNDAAFLNKHVSIISAGWDPGTFSVERVLADAFVPGSNPQATYGLTERGGLSMGHSDAIRTIHGVKDARQYTHATPEAIKQMRQGKGKGLTAREKMWRECFVVLENDNPESRARAREKIETMPTYFEPYKTIVNFVSEEELKRNHSGMPHDGLVIAVGETGQGNRATIEYKNQWASNPEGTASILIACARAANRMHTQGKNGAFTMLHVPPMLFSARSEAELIHDFM